MVLPGGAPLFRQGEPADAVYVVASGCLGVFRHQEAGDAREPLLIAEIPPGNLVGEMSLLSQGKRTRSVAALRDSEVWRLAQTSFNALTSHHPEVLPALMRSVVARNAADTGKRRRQPRTFAILPSGPDVPSARFAVMLADALGRIGNQVQMLGHESADQEPEWFARCEMESSFVLYRADRDADALDRTLPAPGRLPGRPSATPTTTFRPSCRSRSRRRRAARYSIAAASWCCCTRATIPSQARPPPCWPAAFTAQHHHVRLDIHSDIDRLARLLTGHAVGVVMAGGGARAFTHIGVVKALRKSGVPIDLVGGTSMGAIVAAGVASRWNDEELDARFRRAFVNNNPLSDYTVPLISLFAGRRVTRLLRAAFGEKDIEDLILPFYCVTANLTTSNADIHTVGRLWRWLRASRIDPRRDAALQRGGRGPCRRRRDRQLSGAGHAAHWGAASRSASTSTPAVRWRPAPASWNRGRLGSSSAASIWKRNETLPIPSIVAHPAALGAGREHRARGRGPQLPPSC